MPSKERLGRPGLLICFRPCLGLKGLHNQFASGNCFFGGARTILGFKDLLLFIQDTTPFAIHSGVWDLAFRDVVSSKVESLGFSVSGVVLCTGIIFAPPQPNSSTHLPAPLIASSLLVLAGKRMTGAIATTGDCSWPGVCLSSNEHGAPRRVL